MLKPLKITQVVLQSDEASLSPPTGDIQGLWFFHTLSNTCHYLCVFGEPHPDGLSGISLAVWSASPWWLMTQRIFLCVLRLRLSLELCDISFTYFLLWLFVLGFQLVRSLLYFLAIDFKCDLQISSLDSWSLIFSVNMPKFAIAWETHCWAGLGSCFQRRLTEEGHDRLVTSDSESK